MANDRLEKIQQHIERLRDERVELLAREKKTERMRQTQQCILVGAWAIANTPDIVEIVKAQLTRNSDRAAFGMAPLEAANEDLDIPLPLAGSHHA